MKFAKYINPTLSTLHAQSSKRSPPSAQLSLKTCLEFPLCPAALWEQPEVFLKVIVNQTQISIETLYILVLFSQKLKQFIAEQH